MKNVSKANTQKHIKMQLQRFAPTPTTPTDPYGGRATDSKNNNQGVRTYALQFAGMIGSLFEKRAYFAPFFGGLETKDDISDNHAAFYLKVNNTPVTIGQYDVDPDVAFGEGTGKTTRFGERTEVIYSTLAVPYTWDWKWHEGIDRATVNMGEAEAIADRLALQAQAKLSAFNQHHAKFISDTATALTTKAAGEAPTADEAVKAFNEAFKKFTNMETVGVKRAYVVADVWNMIVDNGLATNDAKDAGVNIATNKVYSFKDFILELIPDDVKGNDGDLAYFTIDRSAKAFTGVETARTIESEDFDGRAFQGRGRAGEYINEDNKKAVLKFTGTVTP